MIAYLPPTSAREPVTRGCSPVTNALTFDIEDWFHLMEIEAVSDPAKWPSLPSLVVDYTKRILDTVGAANVRATFFVLGWVAERHPSIVKSIAAAGHEIATHSYWHRCVGKLSRRELRNDLKRSIDVLEQQSGQKVLGFRAPSFSITPGDEWIFDLLLDLGLVYDASLFPAARGNGGYHACTQKPHLLTTPSGRAILELPMSITSLGPLRVPFSGGGYLRLFPKTFIRHGFRSLNRQGVPVVVYLHPRDFAPECPRVPMPLKRRFKCYVGLKSTAGKLQMLLRNFRFNTCAAVLGVEEQARVPVSVTTRPVTLHRLPVNSDRRPAAHGGPRVEVSVAIRDARDLHSRGRAVIDAADTNEPQTADT